MNIRSALVSVAALASFATSPAQASTIRVATAVDITDLDLSDPHGVAKLEKRLEVAVRRLCGTYDNRDGVGARPVRECVKAARLNPDIETLIAEAKVKRPAESPALAAR